MYNRYVPQADGSFRRSRIPEPAPERERPAAPPPPMQEPVTRESPHSPNESCAPPRQHYSYPHVPPARRPPAYDNGAGSVGSFLKGLLPQNFDTEDLMVVLLLLLMSGNSGTDQNAALMTWVIYLFL